MTTGGLGGHAPLGGRAGSGGHEAPTETQPARTTLTASRSAHGPLCPLKPPSRPSGPGRRWSRGVSYRNPVPRGHVREGDPSNLLGAGQRRKTEILATLVLESGVLTGASDSGGCRPRISASSEREVGKGGMQSVSGRPGKPGPRPPAPPPPHRQGFALRGPGTQRQRYFPG